MEDVYSHLSKLNKLISSIQSTKVHALEALALGDSTAATVPIKSKPRNTVAQQTKCTPMKPERATQKSSQDTKRLHLMNSRIDPERMKSPSASNGAQQKEITAPKARKAVHDTPRSPKDKSREEAEFKAKKQKSDAEAREKLAKVKRTRQGEKKRVGMARVGKRQAKLAPPKAVVKVQVAKRVKPAKTNEKQKKVEKEKQREREKENQTEEQEEQKKKKQVCGRNTGAQARSENTYMLVPSKHRYVLTKGSRFLRCNEDYSPTFAAPHTSVFICEQQFRVRSVEASVIELDRAPDFDVRSYDGKVTVYFKVLLRDLSPKWIRYCRMHGSGKLHTSERGQEDIQDERKRCRLNRKLMRQEDELIRAVTLSKDRAQRTQALIEAAQRITKERIRMKSQQRKHAESQEREEQEASDRKKRERRISSIALAKELRRKSQLRIKEYLNRTARGDKSATTPEHTEQEVINADTEQHKRGSAIDSYREVVIQRVRKAKAEERRNSLQQALEEGNQDTLSPRGGVKPKVVPNPPPLRFSEEKNRLESPRQVQAPEHRRHIHHARKVVLQQALDASPTVSVGFRVIDL